MIREPHIIGAYTLILQKKRDITWEDVISCKQDHLPEDDTPYDAVAYHAATELAFAFPSAVTTVTKYH